MAKIEVNKYLGSSQDNFIVFSNENYARPYVVFQITGNRTSYFTISDALDEDGYKKTIKYGINEVISDSSFSVGSNTVSTTFALMECLRKNPIFYDLEIYQNSGGGTYLRAYIDSSTKYEIKDYGSVGVSGTYSSWTPKEPNKFVLMENNGEKQILLEKYTMANDVSFNVTAPYEHLSFKDPFQVKMMAYKVVDNQIYQESIANNSVYVFPTTLSKFDDTYIGDFEGEFLTRNHQRSYNYDEVCALSVMSDDASITKKYYSNSGKFLMQDSDVLYKERHEKRTDLYFKFNVQYVEGETNRQVGYVEVSCGKGDDVVYKVEAKCNANNEIFFVNELGGIDSFNFLGERDHDSKIQNQTTYFINPTRRYVITKELEVVGQKVNKVEHTLTTSIVDMYTALWLDEMKKSKYHFLYKAQGSTRFERIVVTEMNVDVNDRENTFEIQLTYQDGDNNLSI